MELNKKENNIKYVDIDCNCKNKSYFKVIDQGKFVFDNSDELPEIVMGTQVEDMSVAPLHLKQNQTLDKKIRILINAGNHSDEEIMDILKNVKIKIIASQNYQIVAESKPVRLDI